MKGTPFLPGAVKVKVKTVEAKRSSFSPRTGPQAAIDLVGRRRGPR